MRSFLGKLWSRIVLLLLFCLFSTAGMFSFLLYGYALEDGWYGKEDYTFADTRMCRVYAQDALSFVSRNLSWLGNPRDTTLGGYGGNAFSYIIKDAVTGEVYADTRGDNSYYVMDHPRDVTTDSGMFTCQISGYVNLPVQPYEGCYREYYVFEHLFPMRGSFLPAGIVFVLLAATALGLSIAAAALEGRGGRVTVLGRIPLDVAVVGFLLLSRITVTLIYDLLGYTVTSILRQMGIYEVRFYQLITVWCVGVLCVILANQMSAGVFRQRLLVHQIITRTPTIVLKLLLLALHLGVTVLGVICCSGGRVYELIEGRWLDLPGLLFAGLGVFDLLLLPWIIGQILEENRVKKASNALAAGELNYTVATQHLHGIWKKLGLDLNSIGKGMTLAVEDRLRSERMKTELITNVSHDLKTPLTSIINYIALLKDDSLPEQTKKEYIEVLDRQSAKLKKLTEDVVEASKAASGVVNVEPEILDVAELLTQSVGEYSERLQSTGIIPVIHTPEDETYILADGRLLGRVLDNFITNIIKYAQPGTRAYFDLLRDDKQVLIQVKNTSREPLDIPAEELMERFVRGDSSRSTEGSGLGLSIARSLTELMGGALHLTLDGDFFKVEVVFPGVRPPEKEKGLAEEAVTD